jgi:hypothetical protein
MSQAQRTILRGPLSRWDPQCTRLELAPIRRTVYPSARQNGSGSPEWRVDHAFVSGHGRPQHSFRERCIVKAHSEYRRLISLRESKEDDEGKIGPETASRNPGH